MKYEGIKVGRTERVIQCDERTGDMEYIDGTPVSDLDEEEIQECAIALDKHLKNESYVNSQDL